MVGRPYCSRSDDRVLVQGGGEKKYADRPLERRFHPVLSLFFPQLT